jgi:hypothetical protein
MRNSTKTLLVVLLTLMSFLAVQTAWAEKPNPPESEWKTVSGKITAIDPDNSTITIDYGTVIKGFPFGYLEREIVETTDVFGDDFAIDVGDCAEVAYATVDCRCDEGSKKIAVALNRYCECEACENKYEDWSEINIVLRDDDFYPVDKSRHGDDSDHNRHRNK